MAFEAGKKYPVIVADAGRVESKTGTLGLSMRLRGEDGSEIWHTEWITANTEKNFLKRMAELDLERGVFESEEFWEDPFAILAGKKAEIETMLDDYDGKSRVRVKWFNGRERVLPKNKGEASRFARFFRKEEQAVESLSGTSTPFDDM